MSFQTFNTDTILILVIRNTLSFSQLQCVLQRDHVVKTGHFINI